MFIRITIITTTGHHDDAPREISAYINDPKKSAQRARISKSYIVHGQPPSASVVHRQTHFLMRLPWVERLSKFRPAKMGRFFYETRRPHSDRAAVAALQNRAKNGLTSEVTG